MMIQFRGWLLVHKKTGLALNVSFRWKGSRFIGQPMIYDTRAQARTIKRTFGYLREYRVAHVMTMETGP